MSVIFGNHNRVEKIFCLEIFLMDPFFQIVLIFRIGMISRYGDNLANGLFGVITYE